MAKLHQRRDVAVVAIDNETAKPVLLLVDHCRAIDAKECSCLPRVRGFEVYLHLTAGLTIIEITQGADHPECVGDRLFDWLYAGHHNRTRRAIRHAMQTGTPQTLKVCSIDWCRWDCTLWPLPSGEFIMQAYRDSSREQRQAV